MLNSCGRTHGTQSEPAEIRASRRLTPGSQPAARGPTQHLCPAPASSAAPGQSLCRCLRAGRGSPGPGRAAAEPAAGRHGRRGGWREPLTPVRAPWQLQHLPLPAEPLTTTAAAAPWQTKPKPPLKSKNFALRGSRLGTSPQTAPASQTRGTREPSTPSYCSDARQCARGGLTTPSG